MMFSEEQEWMESTERREQAGMTHEPSSPACPGDDRELELCARGIGVAGTSPATTRRASIQYGRNGSGFRLRRSRRGRAPVSTTAVPYVSGEYNQPLTSQLALHFRVPGDPPNEFPRCSRGRG